MEKSHSMSCFLLGLGIGAAGALLFAPKSGTETRNFLQSKGAEAADIVKLAGQDLRDRAVETIERGSKLFGAR